VKSVAMGLKRLPQGQYRESFLRE